MPETLEYDGARIANRFSDTEAMIDYAVHTASLGELADIAADINDFGIGRFVQQRDICFFSWSTLCQIDDTLCDAMSDLRDDLDDSITAPATFDLLEAKSDWLFANARNPPIARRAITWRETLAG